MKTLKKKTTHKAKSRKRTSLRDSDPRTKKSDEQITNADVQEEIVNEPDVKTTREEEGKETPAEVDNTVENPTVGLPQKNDRNEINKDEGQPEA